MLLPQEIYDKIIMEFAEQDVIEKTRFLQSCFIKNCTEDFDIYTILSKHNFDNAKWLIMRNMVNLPLVQILTLSAKTNNIEIVKWLFIKMKVIPDKEAMDYAAMNGHMEIVKYLYDIGCSCTTNAMDYAAMNGHLEIVKYLHDIGCSCTKNAMDYAGMNGHIEVIQFLHYNRIEGCTEYAMDWAASSGYLNVLEWLNDRRDEGCTAFAFLWACELGRLHVVQWLYKVKRYLITYKIRQRGIQYASLNGHIKIVEWLC